MIDYNVLKVIWWMIIGGVLVIYASTAGFDVGVTTIMAFLKKESQRRLALNVSAPTWDGNLTWIVFAGGALFVVWPVVYSTAFSGMYAAMLLILFPLFLRPPGYEYRNKIDSPRWRRFWDIGLFVSGVLPVFLFGVATGNCFRGFPFYFDPISLRSFYDGNLFGLLNPIGIMAGLLSVCMVVFHGATYLNRRTTGDLQKKAKKLVFWIGIVFLILLIVAGSLIVFYTRGYTLLSLGPSPELNILNNDVVRSTGGWFQSYFVYPWKFFGPAIAFAGIFIALFATYFDWRNFAFWGSAFAIGGCIATAGFTLFPFIMPSSTNPAESLTIWNSVSSQYALNTMLYVGVVLLLVILGYKIFAYHSIWGQKPTLSEEDVEENKHTFY